MSIECNDCRIKLDNPIVDNDVEYLVCPQCGNCYERKFIPNRNDKDFCIKKFEEEYGKTLPKAYVKFIKSESYSKSKSYYIKIKNKIPQKLKYYLSNNTWNIYQINGVDIDSDHSLFISSKMTKEWDLPKDLVLLDGDGHTWVALDYKRNKKNPPVIFIETDEYNEFVLAKDFEEFLSLLTEEK